MSQDVKHLLLAVLRLAYAYVWIFWEVHNKFFRRNIHQEPRLTKRERMIATGKPHVLASIPLMRFMPKRVDISVGNMRMMENDVSVRITVFMLLLMIEV
jgi:hypothetical protein